MEAIRNLIRYFSFIFLWIFHNLNLAENPPFVALTEYQRLRITATSRKYVVNVWDENKWLTVYTLLGYKGEGAHCAAHIVTRFKKTDNLNVLKRMVFTSRCKKQHKLE